MVFEFVYFPLAVIYVLNWTINFVGNFFVTFKTKFDYIFVGINTLTAATVSFILIIIAIIMPESLVVVAKINEQNSTFAFSKRNTQEAYILSAFWNLWIILANMTHWCRKMSTVENSKIVDPEMGLSKRWTE